MRKKSEFTTVERAIQTVNGFQKVFNTLQQQTILRGQSQSTLDNYIRQIALISLEFNKLPEDLSEEEINEYLTALALSPKSPSRSSFKHAVYGLRYYYRHIGQTKRAIDLPSLKKEATLPVILNRSELRQLFRTPKLLKHRIALTLIYSAGLRSQEASNMKISDIDFERKTIHIRQSKYKKDRIVPLSDYMAKGLKKYLVERPQFEVARIVDRFGQQYVDECHPNSFIVRTLDARLNDALDVRYFHIVFTIPEELNQICLLDSNLFYKSLFECVWSVLQQFGYTKLCPVCKTGFMHTHHRIASKDPCSNKCIVCNKNIIVLIMDILNHPL